MADVAKTKKVPKKLSELSKTDRIFRICNKVLNGVLFAFVIGLMIYYAVTQDPHNRVLACVGSALLLILPNFIEYVFKKRITNIVYLFYLVYLILASIMGSALRGYSTMTGLDKVVHSIFGYVGSLLGLFYICKVENINNFKIKSVMFFCFMVSMACGGLWEIYEFSCDQFLGQTAQGIPTPEGVTSVVDTMLDLVCNLGGACVFLIHYALYAFTKKNWGMKAIIGEFTNNTLLKEISVQTSENNENEKEVESVKNLNDTNSSKK